MAGPAHRFRRPAQPCEATELVGDRAVRSTLPRLGHGSSAPSCWVIGLESLARPTFRRPIKAYEPYSLNGMAHDWGGEEREHRGLGMIPPKALLMQRPIMRLMPQGKGSTSAYRPPSFPPPCLPMRPTPTSMEPPPSSVAVPTDRSPVRL